MLYIFHRAMLGQLVYHFLNLFDKKSLVLTGFLKILVTNSLLLKITFSGLATFSE